MGVFLKPFADISFSHDGHTTSSGTDIMGIRANSSNSSIGDSGKVPEMFAVAQDVNNQPAKMCFNRLDHRHEAATAIAAVFSEPRPNPLLAFSTLLGWCKFAKLSNRINCHAKFELR